MFSNCISITNVSVKADITLLRTGVGVPQVVTVYCTLEKAFLLNSGAQPFFTANYSGASDLVKCQGRFLKRSINIFNILVLSGTRCSTCHLGKVNGNRMHNTG